jgi:phosphoglycerol transferase MdoB-like AlkP superfamily enzyme
MRSDINLYINHLLTLLKRLFFLLLAFSILRLVFFLFNLDSFVPGSFQSIIKAFLFGIRFDFIVIFYMNLPFILMHFIPGNFKNSNTYQQALRYLFVIINIILLSANFIDVEYFRFLNRRSGTELIKMLVRSSDTVSLLPHYITNYWHITFMWLITAWALWKFFPKVHHIKSNIKLKPAYSAILQVALTIIILGVFFLISRGTETKPVRINTAHKYASPRYIPLLFNTPFVMLNTISQKDQIKADYFDLGYCEKIYSPIKLYGGNGTFKGQNVVIIILESFSKEYIGALNPAQKGNTPFLDSLINESLTFDNAFANASRSLDALPAIVTSLPPLNRSSLITSVYSTNELEGIASVLKDKGYHTSFFHGGQNGTMGFDYFCKSAGIEEYYGESEYPCKGDRDGTWGIFDEEFLQFFAGKLDQFESPFLSIIFTLSSHEPYPIPKKYKNKFNKSKVKILNSIAYTDYSLKRFFEKASGSDWFSNTLFIICADHTSYPMEKYYGTQIGRYKIPVIYYHPGDTSLRGICHDLTQQIDIFPSVMDYLNYNSKFIAFGYSVFSEEKPKFWFCHKSGSYYIADSSFFLIFDGLNSIELYDYKIDSLLQKNIITEKPQIAGYLESNLKAILQNYQYRLEKNLLSDTARLTPWISVDVNPYD